MQRMHVAFRATTPHPIQKCNSCLKNLLILQNPWSPKECKQIKLCLTEFNMKINSEFNREVTFLYEFLPLKSFSFCTVSQSKRSKTSSLQTRFNITTSLRVHSGYTCVSALSSRRDREQINSRYSKSRSILFFN